jgi:hypothetical protein
VGCSTYALHLTIRRPTPVRNESRNRASSCDHMDAIKPWKHTGSIPPRHCLEQTCDRNYEASEVPIRLRALSSWACCNLKRSKRCPYGLCGGIISITYTPSFFIWCPNVLWCNALHLFPTQGFEVRVIDLDTGRILVRMKGVGGILVRNSFVRFAGYKDNKEASRGFDAKGWFHSAMWCISIRTPMCLSSID